eukprot:1157898-Pelagomonas_calceolata.AAC.1
MPKNKHDAFAKASGHKDDGAAILVDAAATQFDGAATHSDKCGLLLSGGGAVYVPGRCKRQAMEQEPRHYAQGGGLLQGLKHPLLP